MEGSLYEFGTPPPHNLDITHALVDGYTHIIKYPLKGYDLLLFQILFPHGNKVNNISE